MAILGPNFPYTINPLTNISPFTYRDGATYLEILEGLRNYINNNLRTEFNEGFNELLVDFQAGITNAETTITDLSVAWTTQYDAFIANFTNEIALLNASAVAGMVTDPGTVRTSLLALIDAEIQDEVDALETYTDNAVAAATIAVNGYTDGAVAGALSTAGTNATAADAALEAELRTDLATQASVAGKLDTGRIEAAGLEYNEDFSDRPNGAVTTAHTGQPYSLLGPALVNTGGFVTYANTDDGGAYASVELDGDALWLGGEFKFTPYSVSGGLAVFAMCEEDIYATQTALEGLPRMSAHLCISPLEITLDVLTVKGTAVTRIWSHQFATPLASDDTTVYSAWIALDRKTGVAYVVDPTGEVHSIAHAGFKIPSRWVFFEPFRTLGSATSKTLAKFAKVQADSRDSSRPAVLGALAKLHTLKKVAHTQPASFTELTLTSSQQPITGTLLKTTVPSTGKLRARMQAFVDITSTTGAVMFNLIADDNNVIAAKTAGVIPEHSGWITVDTVIENLTAGSILSTRFSATALSGATAKLKYGSDDSLSRYGVTVILEPYN